MIDLGEMVAYSNGMIDGIGYLEKDIDCALGVLKELVESCYAADDAGELSECIDGSTIVKAVGVLDKYEKFRIVCKPDEI